MDCTVFLRFFVFIVIPGYTVITGCSPDDNCDTCPPSYSFNNWGDNCNKQCPPECNSGCNRTTGECDLGCKEGYYDHTCSSACPTGCNKTCEQSTGYCTKCVEGKYKMKCNKECSQGCQGVCEQKTGICIACKPGLTGDFCNQRCPCGCAESCQCAGWPNCSANNGTQLLSTYHVFILSAMMLVVFSQIIEPS